MSSQEAEKKEDKKSPEDIQNKKETGLNHQLMQKSEQKNQQRILNDYDDGSKHVEMFQSKKTREDGGLTNKKELHERFNKILKDKYSREKAQKIQGKNKQTVGAQQQCLLNFKDVVELILFLFEFKINFNNFEIEEVTQKGEKGYIIYSNKFFIGEETQFQDYCESVRKIKENSDSINSFTIEQFMKYLHESIFEQWPVVKCNFKLYLTSNQRCNFEENMKKLNFILLFEKQSIILISLQQGSGNNQEDNTKKEKKEKGSPPKQFQLLDKMIFLDSCKYMDSDLKKEIKDFIAEESQKGNLALSVGSIYQHISDKDLSWFIKVKEKTSLNKLITIIGEKISKYTQFICNDRAKGKQMFQCHEIYDDTSSETKIRSIINYLRNGGLFGLTNLWKNYEIQKMVRRQLANDKIYSQNFKILLAQLVLLLDYKIKIYTLRQISIFELLYQGVESLKQQLVKFFNKYGTPETTTFQPVTNEDIETLELLDLYLKYNNKSMIITKENFFVIPQQMHDLLLILKRFKRGNPQEKQIRIYKDLHFYNIEQQYAMDHPCQGCRQFFTQDIPMFDRNAVSFPVYFSRTQDLKHSMISIRTAICTILNDGGGMIFFDCKGENNQMFPVGKTLTQKQKTSIQDTIYKMIYDYFIPSSEARASIKISFVPVVKSPLKHFYQHSWEQYIGQDGFIHSQQYKKREYKQGFFVTRIIIKPTDITKVFFFKARNTPQNQKYYLQTRINGERQTKRMNNLHKQIKKKMKNLQLQKKYRHPIDHECIRPHAGKVIYDDRGKFHGRQN